MDLKSKTECPNGLRLTARVEKVLAHGEGLVRSQRGVVLIPFVLPGELVDFEVEVAPRKGVLRGSLRQILEASPHRVLPSCGLYGDCGACDLMHGDAAVQGEIKRSILVDSFRRQGQGLSADWIDLVSKAPLHQGQPWAYRNRMRFHILANGRPGLQPRRGNSPLACPDCPIAHQRIRQWLGDADRPQAGLPGMNLPVFADKDSLAVGQQPCHASLKGVDFTFPPEAFFQSNLGMMELLLDRLDLLLDGLGGPLPRQALDLYGGVGVFSEFLARRFPQVTLVEENPLACKAALEHFAGRQGIAVSQGTVEQWLKTRPKALKQSLVLVDPPRTGLDPALVARLNREQPRFLCYVSCNPVTLARDSGLLAKGGWQPVVLEAFDFYPQTWHFESLVLMEHRGAG